MSFRYEDIKEIRIGLATVRYHIAQLHGEGESYDLQQALFALTNCVSRLTTMLEEQGLDE